MNLKFKWHNKVTAVIQITSDTTAIFSDEVSPTHINSLRLITSQSPEDLKNQCITLTKELAGATRHPPVMVTIKDKAHKITKL